MTISEALMVLYDGGGWDNYASLMSETYTDQEVVGMAKKHLAREERQEKCLHPRLVETREGLRGGWQTTARTCVVCGKIVEKEIT